MLPSGTHNVNHGQDIALIRTRAQWVMFVVFLIVLFSIPLYGSKYILNVLSIIAIIVIAVEGLNILTGYCGQLSIGQSAFMGVGSYLSVILIQRFQMPFLAALLAGGLGSGLIGTLFGISVVRIKGFYLAMATFAAQLILVWLFLHMEQFTGGSTGLRVAPASILGLSFSSAIAKYYLIMIVTLLMFYFAKNLMRTRLGRILVAIRDNDLAAKVMGINLSAYKLIAFFLCCFYAGIAGALWAHHLGFIGAEQFSLNDSILYVGMLIIGGMGSIMGSVFGVVFFTLINEGAIIVSPMLSRAFPLLGPAVYAALILALYALAIVIFIIFEPRGINHRWQILKNQYRLYPFAY